MAATLLEVRPMNDDGPRREDDGLLHAIEHAAHLLPSQGPITAFVHHNTLHAFEHLSFDEGVRAGGRLFGCHAYLAEEQYRQKFSRGRIRLRDLEAVLLEELGDEADRLVAMFGTRYALRLAMLQFPLQTGPPAELRWMIAETDALRRFRPEVPPDVRERMVDGTRRRLMQELVNREGRRPVIDVLGDVWEQFDRRTIESWSERTWEAFVLNFLWRVCRRGVSTAAARLSEQAPPPGPHRHRDLLLKATGQDTDLLVDEPLIRFCAAFVDQGFAEWELPDRRDGFYRSFLKLHARRGAAPTRWTSRLQQVTQRLLDMQTPPLQSIAESLQLLGVDSDERDEFIVHSLLALRGWAGMIWQLETNAEWVPHPAPPGTLVEYLAVRLILDRLAVHAVARDALGFEGPLDQVRQAAQRRSGQNAYNDTDRRAFTVFQLAQVRGWKPEDLQHLSREQWHTLVREIEAFSALERRRVFHLAFERKYRNETLDAIVAHSRRRRDQESNPCGGPRRPAWQIVCCIDDREESLRRHLEEVDPDCETLSAAGFFGVAMYYRGSAGAHFQPLCPNTIKPRHYVTEEPLYSFIQSEQRRAEARRRIGRATHHAHRGTRTFLGGWLTGLLGSLAAFPLVGRVLFPRTTARIRRRLGGIVHTPGTELHLERTEADPGPANGHIGYTVEEMAGIVEGGLRALGLARPELISPLVLICGHGSASLNNPHESAYNCGACSGGRGGPNARAFARMANDVRVRRLFEGRGLRIPEDTCFVGCFHNTCDDHITWFDLDDISIRQRELFERARAALDTARQRNAHERCRRFETVELSVTVPEAARIVEARAEDLSQARPEYNHATNALCLVGRRHWSCGLFLDRRAFLTSYDPAQDDERSSILERSLQAAIPVCAGISLEYYFSTVDVEGWGSGSKLPHNITSLLGVMTGAASDLRPGLSAQMVEIHEPLRLLFVVETTPSAMERIIEDNEAIARLVRGEWVHLAVFNAATSCVHVYRDGEFIPYEPESTDLPRVDSSAEWYRGCRENLGFATIDPHTRPEAGENS